MRPTSSYSKAILTIVLSSFCALFSLEAYATQPSSVAFYDTWTSVKTLEDSKAYVSLTTFLDSLLQARSVDRGPAEASGNSIKVHDPEGVAYLLDDLAEIHARGLVDFQKAISYNEKVSELYEKIQAQGLTSLPLSDYFNPRRTLYYYIHIVEDEVNDTRERAIKDLDVGTLFKSQPKVATMFPDTVLTAVRKADFLALGDRIGKRRAYLNHKLGLLPLQKQPTEMEDLVDDMVIAKGILQHLQIYNDYYKNAYLAGKLWFIHRQGGPVDYREFAALSRSALESEKGQRMADDLDSYNLLSYWAGISYLKLGDAKEGTYYLRRFFRGLDDVDDLSERLAKERKRVMGKAIEQKEKAWETFMVVLAVAGSVAGAAVSVAGQVASYGSYQSVQAAQAAAYSAMQQAFIRGAANSLGLSLVTQLGTAKVDLDTQETRKLAGLVTPLALKAARYLDRFDQVELFSELGRAYRKLGQDGKAIRFYGEALSIIEAQRSTISSEKQRISFSAVKEEIYKSIIPLLIKENRVERAFEYLERAKARAFLDVLASKQGLVLKTSRDTEQFRSLLRGKDEVAALLEQRGLGLEQVTSVLTRLGRGVTITEQAPQETVEIESLTDGKIITAEEARQLSREQFSILEYFISDARLYIFLIDDGRVIVKAVEIDERRLFNLITALRDVISNPQSSLEQAKSVAYELYATLVRPVRDRISKRRIFIIPHGWLYYVPFQVLRNADTGRYLIEDFAITYAPSTTVVKYSLEKSQVVRKDSILVLANADLGDSRYDLPYAEEEASSIAKSFKRSTVLMRKEATESRFRESAPAYDVVHVATHAYFDANDPLRSAILLAGDEKNDGRVEATELYQFNLKASLVVLSACQTGLAYVVQGDELIGLIRGVIYSGADAVLSTLWSVDDRSTAEVMKSFYEGFKMVPKDLALQQAQVATMQLFPHPFNWAPFILTGSPN